MTEPFYRTRAWKLARQEILARDGYLCQRCLTELELLTVADTVHHVEHLDSHPHLALVESNLLSVCAQCHNALHKKAQPRPKREPKRKARVITV